MTIRKPRTVRAIVALLVGAQVAGCASTRDSDGRSNHEVCQATAAGEVGTVEFQNNLYVYRQRGLSDAKCQELARAYKSGETAAGVVGAIAVGALFFGAAKRGGGFAPPPAIRVDVEWDWDRFRGSDGLLVWVCRGVQTGQFSTEDRCFGKLRTDFRWPGDNFY